MFSTSVYEILWLQTRGTFALRHFIAVVVEVIVSKATLKFTIMAQSESKHKATSFCMLSNNVDENCWLGEIFKNGKDFKPFNFLQLVIGRWSVSTLCCSSSMCWIIWLNARNISVRAQSFTSSLFINTGLLTSFRLSRFVCSASPLP